MEHESLDDDPGRDAAVVPGIERADRLAIPQCTLLVAGVVRNGQRRMRGDLKSIRRAVSKLGFKRVHWLVVESDSDDDTVDILHDLRSTWDDFDFISLETTRYRHPLRTDRIANSRNAYLLMLEKDRRYRDVTHVLVADLDGVCRDLSARAIASCWDMAEPWSACMANQGDYYYDVWALRHRHWCPGDAWAQRGELLPLMGATAADELALFSRMVHLPRACPPIEVDSAFGGLAIYCRDALRGARYVGLDERGGEVCEHVALHAGMRAQGHRLFINPALVNARKTRHAGRKAMFRSLRRAAWNLLRDVFGGRTTRRGPASSAFDGT